MHGRFGAYVQLGETPEDRDESRAARRWAASTPRTPSRSPTR